MIWSFPWGNFIFREILSWLVLDQLAWVEHKGCPFFDIVFSQSLGTIELWNFHMSFKLLLFLHFILTAVNVQVNGLFTRIGAFVIEIFHCVYFGDFIGIVLWWISVLKVGDIMVVGNCSIIKAFWGVFKFVISAVQLEIALILWPI